MLCAGSLALIASSAMPQTALAQDGVELKGPQTPIPESTPRVVPSIEKPDANAPLRGYKQSTSIEPGPNTLKNSEPGSGSSMVVGIPQGGVNPPQITESPIQASVSDIFAQANQLTICPLARIRDEHLRFVELHVRNDTDQAALINGDAVQAELGSSSAQPVTSEYITHDSRPGLGGKGTAAVVAVSGLSLGLAGPIFYEMLTPSQHGKRYLGTAIGTDGARHSVEASRFGLRVVMPGDETYGWLAFECPDNAAPTKLSIPIGFHKSLTPDGRVVVQVSQLPPQPPANAPDITPIQAPKDTSGGSGKQK